MINGPKSTTMRNGGRNTPIAAIVAPAIPATRYPTNTAVMTTGPRRDHAHRDRVEELALGQPAEVVDHSLLEERDDGQARSECERARLGEEDPECHERVEVGAL